MGLGPSKEKIGKILEKSLLQINDEGIINYKYKMDEDFILNIDENLEAYNEDSVTFNFSQKDKLNDIDSPDCDIKNIKNIHILQ